MSALIEALRKKFGTPQAALAALGLDAALLDGNTEEKMRLSRRTATAIAAALRTRGKLAMDVDPETVVEILEQLEEEPVRDAEPNAGMPPWLEARREDEDDDFETDEERREDEEAEDRRRALDRLMGRRATDEEFEEEMFKPDTSNAIDLKRAEDRRRIRADDARRRLGRDETEEECEKREREEEAGDRRVARDRMHHAHDYRRALDRHRGARDRLRRYADDWRRHSEDRKRADDACRSAEDAKKADDAKKHADDRRRADDRMRRAAEDARKAYDEVCAARDARRSGLDARRAEDRKHARDNPPPFKGMPEPGGKMVTEEAMDAAIERRLAENDAKHRGIAAAQEAVRPKVGRIAMDESVQSEADVYGRALDVLGVPRAGITQLPALKQMFAMAPKPGDQPAGGRHQLAHDAAPPDSHAKFESLFGSQAASIQRM